MSSKDLARRSSVEIAFDGVVITDSIVPYLLSMTYTDVEGSEADDLQIVLQDRNMDWIQWITDIVDKASETQTQEEATAGTEETTEAETQEDDTAGEYQVVDCYALWIRKGPGLEYGEYTAVAVGTKLTVNKIENGWAELSYSGGTYYTSAKYISKDGVKPDTSSTSTDSDSEDEDADEEELPEYGCFHVSASILRQNWNGDGKDELLECGQFELDSISYDGAPNKVTLKCTSLPFASTIRQEIKSQGWEKYYLSGIAKEIANRNGMACMFKPENDKYYERVEQWMSSDITFLQKLCDDEGVSLKVTNNIIVIYDQQEYEEKDAVLTIEYGDGQYSEKYKLATGTADVQYDICHVSYVKPDGSLIEGYAYADSYKEDDDEDSEEDSSDDSEEEEEEEEPMVLEITHQVDTIAEAERLAKKYLRLHNKFEKSMQFTIPGNPNVVAGQTVELGEGWGAFAGKYMISSATHKISSSGYTTDIKGHAVLEGY